MHSNAMGEYRKMPVTIQAEQIPQTAHPADLKYYEYLNVERVPFLLRLWVGAYGIKTLEGWHRVRPGDWIITGVKGERYPCKPDIFEMTYEPSN